MRTAVLLIGLAGLTAACSTREVRGISYPRPDVVIDDDRNSDRSRDGDRDRDREYARSPGKVPPGHYPPPGECKIWYVNRPPGHQPPPARCSALIGRVPRGAFLLYNGKAWDTEHDWRRQERTRPGSVPDVVLRIMNSLASK